VLLDDGDQELEKRGLSVVRNADAPNGYVRSKRIGEDALQTRRRLDARLRRTEAKNAVARPWERKFLGYSFWVAKGRVITRRVAPKAPRVGP
jgi:hypothetical protein